MIPLFFVSILYTMTSQPQEYSRLIHFQIIFFLCRYTYFTMVLTFPFDKIYDILQVCYWKLDRNFDNVRPVFQTVQRRFCKKSYFLVYSDFNITVRWHLLKRHFYSNNIRNNQDISFLCLRHRLCSDFCHPCLLSITAIMDSCWWFMPTGRPW